MVGRELTNRFPAREHNVGTEVMFEAKNWTVYHPVYTEKCVDKNVSFKVHKGEIVGFSGLQGAGRTELAMSLFGRSYGSHISGQEFINGKEVHLKNEHDAIEHGLAYATEDRKVNGLVLSDSIAWNTTMAKMDKVSDKRGVINVAAENKAAEEYVAAMKTKTPSIQQAVGNLSGGNQQKVLLSKWMFAEPDVLILDEPTRGIDVGTKVDIQKLVLKLASEGMSITFISSETDEMLRTCSRLVVMRDRKVVGELKGSDLNQNKIMSTIAGGDNSGES